jgi:hypothetical protein
LYTGSIYERELTIRSGILKLPFERGGSLMADKGFGIQDLLDPIGLPTQLTKKDVPFVWSEECDDAFHS